MRANNIGADPTGSGSDTLGLSIGKDFFYKKSPGRTNNDPSVRRPLLLSTIFEQIVPEEFRQLVILTKE